MIHFGIRLAFCFYGTTPGSWRQSKRVSCLYNDWRFPADGKVSVLCPQISPIPNQWPRGRKGLSVGLGGKSEQSTWNVETLFKHCYITTNFGKNKYSYSIHSTLKEPWINLKSSFLRTLAFAVLKARRLGKSATWMECTSPQARARELH